ncbi:MAG TPA: hypothetical protein VEU96_06605 [Bryobacteraceae bacterium]|nr:hypothetical protein [Bryobacteraceae bacterium]
MAKDSLNKGVGKGAGKPQVTASGGEIRLRAVSPKPHIVKHLDVPPPYQRRESIHPRRILPRVREGKEREFHSATERVFARPLAMTMGLRAATDELAVVTNIELAGPGQKHLASNVGEPSVAVNDQVVVYTGNWYAARSADGGQSFQFIDPFTAFPDPPNLGFCCDQVVNYIAAIDTFVWLLQYGPKNGVEADNIQRLAFAKTADVVAGRWRLFDITTKSLGVPGQFLDFPDLAVGANSLYVTTNIFTPQGRGAGAAVIRIPIGSIDSGQVTALPFVRPDLNSPRVAQNCGPRAFFAFHEDSSTINVFTWDEGRADPVQTRVEVARWIPGNGFRSVLPDGQTWLDRADPRITGATLAGTDLYFAWGVNANSNHRPQPFVQIAKIDSTNLTLLENINIFDPNSAICYGGLSTNSDGEVGISYMIGGGELFPSHMVGILTGTRKDVIVAPGERGPLPKDGNGEWGDYLTVRPVFKDKTPQSLFAATGYTMKGAGDGSNRDCTPRYVVFGRASSASGVVQPPASPPAQPVTPAPAPPVPPSPPATPVADGEPITDINTLSVVSPDVAAKIKAAAGLVAGDAAQPFAAPELAAPVKPQQDVPGSERWPVKTGQDPDRAKVGKNVIDGVDLGAGIVESTIEELSSLPRPPGLENPKQDPPEFKDVRDGVTEVTIWRIEATIIALKHEHDGDYHLVLQAASGQEMVGEIPTPTTEFVGDCPWINNIGQARQEIDDKLVKHLSPAAFALRDDKYVPHGALTFQPHATADPAMSFVTPPRGSGLTQPLFQTAITPTAVRLTGVGFFDREHGATGAAPNVIELHPVLKVEWL